MITTNLSPAALTADNHTSIPLEQLMKNIAVQETLYRYVHVNLWENNITPDEQDKVAVTTYVARFMSNCGYDIKLHNDAIFEYFQEHFEGWTESTWDKVNQDYKRTLKNLLRRRGIYIRTGRKNGSSVQQFLSLQTISDPPTWPEGDFLKQQFDKGTEAYTTKMEMKRAAATAAVAFKPSPSPTAAAPVPPPVVQDSAAVPLPAAPLEAYTMLPPADIPNVTIGANAQLSFARLWDRNMKYTGEPYDLLDDKLRIFMRICYNLQIKPGQFHALLPQILTGRAQTYYVDHINWTGTFRTAYDSLKQHFETEVNHRHYYTDWITTTFNKLRAEHPTKSPHKVLQLLFDKLQLCQRALGKDFAGDLPLRYTLVRACRGVPELAFALYNPPDNIETLFSHLRSCLETHLARGTSTRYAQGPQSHYLDRRYSSNHASGRGISRGCGWNYSQGYRGSRPWSKKCFVCGEEGCWSTQHTAEEQQKAKAQCLAHCHFASVPLVDFSAYVMAYEGDEMDGPDDWNEEEHSWE